MHAFEIALCATSQPCIEESDTTFRNIGAQPEHYLVNRAKKMHRTHNYEFEALKGKRPNGIKKLLQD